MGTVVAAREEVEGEVAAMVATVDLAEMPAVQAVQVVAAGAGVKARSNPQMPSWYGCQVRSCAAAFDWSVRSHRKLSSRPAVAALQ